MADFSKYTNSDVSTSPFQSVVFGSQAPLLEVELNEMQEIEFQRMRTFCKNFIGDGVSSESAITYNNGTITLNGQFIVDGYLITCDNISVSNLVAGSVYLKVLVSTVTKSSTIRKNGFVDGSIITNGIQDSRVPMETTRRKSIEYSVVQTVPTESNASYIVLGTIDSNKVFNRSAKVVNVQSAIENQIGTASGSSINLPNSFNGGLSLKELQGKSVVQNGTPSPDSKAEIVSVGEDGSVIVKVCGKNLVRFNQPDKSNGPVTINFSNDVLTINANGAGYAYIRYDVTFLRGKAFKFSYSNLRNTGTGESIQLVKTVNGVLSYTTISKDKGYVIPSDVTSAYFELSANNSSTGNSNTLTIEKPLLMYSDSLSAPYEPYKEQLVTIPLTQPLRSVGSVYDRVLKKNSLWGVERKFAVVVLDGSSDEKWTREPTNTTGIYRFRCGKVESLIKRVPTFNDVANILCNYYKAISTGGTFSKNIGIGVETNGALFIFDSTYETYDYATFTKAIATKPVTVIYELEIPTFEPFSQSVQDQLNKLQSYQGVTNIFTTDSLQPNMLVEYGKSDVSALTLYNTNILDSKEDSSVGTFAEISLDPNLQVGKHYKTQGYYNVGDKGGAEYVITDVKSNWSLDIPNHDGLYADVVETDYVNYKMFGAVLDGVADDDIQLRKAHFYCNAKSVLLKNNFGRIYKANTKTIEVQYDMDLSGSILYITNDNCYAFYKLMNDGKAFSYDYTLDKQYLKRGTSYFPMENNSLPRDCVLKVIDEKVWSVRSDDGSLADTYRSELMFHNVYGNCMGSLIYGYDDSASSPKVSYTPYNNRTLTFIGCEILIETTPNVTCNPILCARHNVVMKNFFINPKHNSLENIQYKNSVIRVDGCYNVTIENVVGTNIAGKPIGGSSASGYAIRLDCSMSVRIRDCHINGFWGSTAMNNVKDVSFEGCTLNRIDVHEYFRDLYINNCTIYDWGVQVGGGTGNLKVTNTRFVKYKAPNVGGTGIININNSYGALFDGVITISNIDVVSEGIDMGLIKCYFISNATTRATKVFPSVIADNITFENISTTATKFYALWTTGSIAPSTRYTRGKYFNVSNVVALGNVTLLNRNCGTNANSNINAVGECIYKEQNGFGSAKVGDSTSADFITKYLYDLYSDSIDDLTGILSYASYNDFPKTGVKNKIYLSEKDNTSYRWNGTKYVIITNGGNADTLDEKHASYFMPKTMDTVYENDLITYVNSLTEEVLPSNGIYTFRAYSLTNMPYAGGDFVCTVLSSSSSVDRLYCSVLAKDCRTNEMYSNTKVNGVWTGWKSFNDKTFLILPTGSNMFNYAEQSSIAEGTVTHYRIGNGKAVPPSFGYVESDNDFFYTVYKLSSEWIRVVALDIRSNREFTVWRSAVHGWGAWNENTKTNVNGHIFARKYPSQNSPMGGTVVLEKSDRSSLGGDFSIDAMGDFMRFYGGSLQKGACLDLKRCDAKAGSRIHTSNTVAVSVTPPSSPEVDDLWIW